ncbi:pentapeptide repeat-containing protein [Acaryochloris marina]|uniref:Pentapeptide repeat protein n=1 Tax=Acaryochloris marina (strain MBIC 11017) TaxID=329726 RepID=A8ZQS2_ACAM1|nr:pentapeptide repeat-containing protein [Acaryochloris marina]ABW33358.1 conserved hypothetical protein [Acaryochloris marina MBIC11017]
MANEEQLSLLKQGVEAWNSWREENLDVEIDLSSADLRNADLRDADLRDADLFNADLFNASLSNASLSGADLTNANLRDASLSNADLSKANLRFASLRYADLSKANLSNASLYEAKLFGANLSNADLRLSKAIRTNFMDADLSGTCITDWHIIRGTNFECVKCSYIYLGYNLEQEKFTDRLPVNPDQEFKPGEFEEWIKDSAEAQQTIDLTFTEGIDWQAFSQSLQGVRQKYPDSGVGLQAIEEKGTAFVIRLKTSLDADQGVIKSSQKELYETQLQLREAQGENRVLREMSEVLEKLASRPTTNVDFNRETQGSDKSNLLMTFLSWFQNGQAIIAIIALVLGVASTYFIPKMFPNGFPPVNSDPQPEVIQSAPSSPRTEIGIGKRMAQQVHQFLLTSEQADRHVNAESLKLNQ